MKKKICFLFFTLVLLLFSSFIVNASPIGWIDDRQVTFTPSNVNELSRVGIDTFDNLHVVWMDRRDGNLELYYTKLNNQGGKLLPDIRLTNNLSVAVSPDAIVDKQNNIHVVWTDDRANGRMEIFYLKLDSNGRVLVPAKMLTTSGNYEYNPKLAIDQNNKLHLVWWNQNNGGTLYYMKLDEKGNVLVGQKQITSSGTSSGPKPVIDNQSNIHVFWTDGRDHQIGFSEVYYKKLDNNGNTLISDRRLTQSVVHSKAPWPVIDKDIIHFVFLQYDSQNSDQVYYSKVDLQGNKLVSEIRVSQDSQGAIFPSSGFALYIDTDSNVHTIWSAKLPGNLYYRKLDKQGVPLTDATRLTSGVGNKVLPTVITDSTNTVHLFWRDGRDTSDGSPYIYYKHTTPVKPVILLHGVCSDPSIWLSDNSIDPNYVTELYSNGFLPINVDYAPGNCTMQNSSGPGCANGDIARYSQTLAQEIDNVKKKYGVKKVDIVTHSMGGLIARFYVKQFGSDNVNQLIMLGTPNHGSAVNTDMIRRIPAYSGWLIGKETATCFSAYEKDAAGFAQMWPYSSFLSTLNYNLNQWDHARWLTTENLPPVIYRNIAGDIPPSTLVYYKATFGTFIGFGRGDWVVPLYYLKLRNPIGISCDLSSSVHWKLHSNKLDYNTVLSYLKNPGASRVDSCGNFGPSALENTTSIEFSPLIIGNILPNQQQQHTFYVDDSTINLSFSIGWQDPANKIDVTLIDPNNAFINRSSTRVAFIDVSARTHMVLSDVIVGNWTVILKGAVINMSEIYDVGATYTSQRLLAVAVSQTTIKPTEQIIIQSFFVSSNNTILQSHSAIATIIKPDQGQDTLYLFDDGQHNDGQPNDGIFGNNYKSTNLEGLYAVKVVHYITQEGPFEKKTLFEVKEPVDVAVTGLSFSNNVWNKQVSSGQIVTIIANVVNNNVRDLHNVSVQLYEDGLPFKEQRVDIAKNQNKNIQFTWTALSRQDGMYNSKTLAVIINPLGRDFEETRYDNNRKDDTILVVPVMALLP